MIPTIVAAVLSWVASAFDAIRFDPHGYYVIGAIVLVAVAVAVLVLWRVVRVPNSTFSDSLRPSLRAVFSSLWRLLRGVVRLYRYGCTAIVSFIPNIISLLCQSLSAGSLSAGFLDLQGLFQMKLLPWTSLWPKFIAFRRMSLLPLEPSSWALYHTKMYGITSRTPAIAMRLWSAEQGGISRQGRALEYVT